MCTCTLIGVSVDTPVGARICRVMLQVSADLIARAPLLNMKQFNGKFGCIYCTDPGTTAPCKPLHRFWPYRPGVTLRTHRTLMSDLREAVADGAPVMFVIYM